MTNFAPITDADIRALLTPARENARKKVLLGFGPRAAEREAKRMLKLAVQDLHHARTRNNPAELSKIAKKLAEEAKALQHDARELRKQAKAADEAEQLHALLKLPLSVRRMSLNDPKFATARALLKR